MKVIYTGYDIREKYKSGETDGKVIDGNYVKIDGQLLPKDFVFSDTPTNRSKLDTFHEDYKAWKALEPNVYALLNSLTKP